MTDQDSEVKRTPRPADLPVGTRLKSVAYKGKHFEAEIVEGEGGEHLVKVGNATFKTLSAAGASITSCATRGGVFWGLIPRPEPKRQRKADAEPQAEEPQPEEPQAEAKTGAKAKKRK